MKHNSFDIVLSSANRLSRNYLRSFFYSFLIPVDYTRTKEIPALLDLSGILARRSDKLRILDIASPQILSLSLALHSDLWEITYINPFEQELEDMRLKSSVLGLNKLRIANADITLNDTLSHLGTFDYIFSCSVFEHIHPEDGGDVIASKNIPQLLTPGGTFIFSVPYYKERFNEYVEGNVYAIKGEQGKKIFFQRFYDEDSLHRQIVEPTALRVKGKTYIGEKFYSQNNIKKRMAFLVGVGKQAFVLGRLFSYISDIFMEETQDFTRLKKPYLAMYSLINDHKEQR